MRSNSFPQRLETHPLITPTKLIYLQFICTSLDSAGCLNLGMRLSRQKGRRFFPSLDVEDRSIPLSTAQRGAQSLSPSSGYVFKGLFLGPSEGAIAPHTYMCLAAKCSRGEKPIDMSVKKSGGLVMLYSVALIDLCCRIYFHILL